MTVDLLVVMSVCRSVDLMVGWSANQLAASKVAPWVEELVVQLAGRWAGSWVVLMAGPLVDLMVAALVEV